VGLGGRGGDRRWVSHGGRSGGGKELVGERPPGEEGSQVLAQQLQQEKRKLLGWLDHSEEGRKDGCDGEVVPVAGVPEGGEEAARKLLRDDVVLLVPLAGAEGLCRGEAERRRSLSLPALWETMLGCGRVKLDGSVSCRESRRCYWSTRSQVGGGVGG
jgi:hypothetical protein